MKNRIDYQAEATVELKEAATKLIELGYTFSDLKEILSDAGDELFEARAFDNDPDLQTDR
jgi:tRNA(His) 5'-end guanylyltransferase